MTSQPFSGQVALVTGASRGLGAAIARALAPTHTLFLAGRPSAELDAVADDEVLAREDRRARHRAGRLPAEALAVTREDGARVVGRRLVDSGARQ